MALSEPHLIAREPVLTARAQLVNGPYMIRPHGAHNEWE